ASPGHILTGMVDSSRLGVAGHSDGAETALAVAANSAVPAPHMDAAVILAGEELKVPKGSYFTVGSPPLMVVQGSADTVNQPAESQAIYNQSPPPKYLLDIVNGTHDAPYEGNGAGAQVVRRTTLAFLDTYLAGHSGAAPRIGQQGDVPGVSTLSDQAPD
ncbi:MAG: hypothetical protein ACRD0J_18055, partial [Acidimicrobiales bacterium]